jgi:uncharacterized protein (DUF488 family)
MIYTIGYQALTMSEFNRILEEKMVSVTVDVRSFPYSGRRDKTGFNKNRMERAFGSRYTWKGDILGGKHGPAQEMGIRYLVEVSRLGSTLLLLSMEADPLECHRFHDIAVRLLPYGIDAVHLPLELKTSELVRKVQTCKS